MVEYIFNISITRHFVSDPGGLQVAAFGHFVVILAETHLEPPLFISFKKKKSAKSPNFC